MDSTGSHFFGFKKGSVMAATIEIPFAPPGKATDPASCRQYGRVMLDAFVHTRLSEPGDLESTDPARGRR